MAKQLDIMLLSDVKMKYVEVPRLPYEEFSPLINPNGADFSGGAGSPYEKGRLQHSWEDLKKLPAYLARVQKRKVA